MKHPIIKVIQTVVKLLIQFIALGNYEINSSFAGNSEIPSPQQFFFRAC
jgi:hypothetical protein